MTVYIPHNDGAYKDYSDAKRYGELHFIGHFGVYPDTVHHEHHTLPEEITAPLNRAAADYDSEEDFVIPTGDIVLVCYFVSLLTLMHKTIRLLKYDRIERAYYQVAML